MEEQERTENTEHAEPELLYHYTDQEGLLGILGGDRKNIWATHFRYLNDTSEGKFVFDSLIDEISRNYQLPKEWSDFFGISKGPALDGDQSVDASTIEAGISAGVWATSATVFITSFSAKGDSISQWRAYSGPSGGFSVGFKSGYLRAIGEEFLRGREDRFMTSDVLIRCEYYEGDKKTLFQRQVGSAVAAYITQASSKPGPEATGKSKIAQRLQPIAMAHFAPLSIYIAKLKHAGFSDESEWRLGFHLMPNSIPSDVSIRPGKSTLVPYLEIPLSVPEPFSAIGIDQIIVGPCPHPEESRKSVEMFLNRSGFRGVQVKNSVIPYRNW